MFAKSLIITLAVSFGLSACSTFKSEKEVVAVSPKPVITKAAAKSAGGKGVAGCSTDGFCALPMLKKKKQSFASYVIDTKKGEFNPPFYI